MLIFQIKVNVEVNISNLCMKTIQKMVGYDYSVVTKPEPHLHLNRKDAGEAKSEYGKYSSIAAEAIDEDIAQKAETCASKEMNEGAELPTEENDEVAVVPTKDIGSDGDGEEMKLITI